MFFGEKTIVGPEKSFACADLMKYVEQLLKETEQRSKKIEVGSNYYSWLKARDHNGSSVKPFLDELRPFMYKLSSESCAAIAVKLDRLTEDRCFSLEHLQTAIKELLLEQDSLRHIQKSVKEVRETKNSGKVNKVHPQLNGRQATVCFVIDDNFIKY